MRSPPRPGEITQRHHDNARQAVINALTALDDGAWLGQLVTESGDHSEPMRPSPKRVQLYPGARLAWDDVDNGCRVFANGELYISCGAVQPFIEQLCGQSSIDYAALKACDAELCAFLVENGVLQQA